MIPSLSPDHLTLHWLATGVLQLTLSIERGQLFDVPYPLPLQRGLDRLTVAALIRNEAPPQGMIELLDWCRNKPLSQWPLEIEHRELYGTATLLDDNWPTAVCEEWVCASPEVEDEITENRIMSSALSRCRELSNPSLYVAFRRLLIERPVLTEWELLHYRRELASLEEGIQAAYEPAPAAYYHRGTYIACGYCGSLLVATSQSELRCEDSICHTQHTTKQGQRWKEHVCQLRRGLRRFVTRPGLTELKLYKELKKRKYEVELWPDFDAYDLRVKVGEIYWGVDVKDWSDPFALARSINTKGAFRASSQSPWERAFWVFPNERRSNPKYLAAFTSVCRHTAPSSPKVEAFFVSDFLKKVENA